LAHHGIQYSGRARQVNGGDASGDMVYLIAMDGENVEALRQRFGDVPHLHRLLDFADHTAVRDVPDPYYGDNFDHVYRLVEDGCRGLLGAIQADAKL
jgi:protein-tyrosine phosphatase